MVCLSSFLGSFSRVAFCGSRLSASSASVSCRAFLPLVSGLGVPVGVGCALGVDSLVRSAFPSALVFSVSSFLVGGRVARALLLCVLLLWFRGVPLVRACLLPFRLVLARLVLPFLLRFVAVALARGVRSLLLLAWVLPCLWCPLRALALLGLVLWLPAFVLSALLPVAGCCGWLPLQVVRYV